MHQTAEFGVAAHWLYKDGKPPSPQRWLHEVVEGADDADPQVFMDALRTGLFDEEVYVFTPKGELKALASGATPLDFAYAVHTDVGHRCVGAKVNGRIVPLSYTLLSGDIVEVLTSKSERGPSRDWLKVVRTTRARNKIRAWFAKEQREDTEQKGRDSLHQALKSNGLPHQKIGSSPLLAALIREMGFKKAEDFYVAIGSNKVPVGQVVTKILQRLKTQEAVPESTADQLIRRRGRSQAVEGVELRHRGRRRRRRRVGARADGALLHAGAGRRDHRLHLGRPRHHDPPHRLPERARADAQPRALHAGRVGRRGAAVVPRHGRGRLVGPHAPAGGRRPHVRRERHATSSSTAGTCRRAWRATGT